MSQQFSHSEWVLNLVVQIDQAHPGFCGMFFRASAERQQVIAAYLAKCPPAPEEAAESARFLSAANHNAILAAAYGDAPPRGLRGALRRSGANGVHEERFYRVLHKLVSKPRHAEVTKCIARFDSLDLMKLRIANILPVPICRVNVVEAITSVQTACDLIVAIKLLVAAGADEAELAAAICNVRNEAAIAKVMKRALLKCRAPEHPVAATTSYRPITTGRQLHKAATIYRNCARNYAIEFLDEDAGHAFAEAQVEGEGAVVHLRRREGSWRLEGVFGRSNYRPSQGLRDHVHAYLAENGIHARKRVSEKSAWDPVRRIAATPLFDFNLE